MAAVLLAACARSLNAAQRAAAHNAAAWDHGIIGGQ